MSRLKSTELGYYIPSFFEMHVNSDCDDLTISKLPLKDMTILFHEYIHFLQDFTTYYGLNSIYVYSEYLHSVTNRIYAIKTPVFQVPFSICDNSDNVLLNRQIQEFTQGDTEESIDFYSVTNIEEGHDQLLSNPYMKEIDSIILNPEGDFRSFGAIAIMESMAYIMERMCSPAGYVKSPDFPYRAAELVADYYVKGFSKNLLMVLALCDMSLQSSNPGACFVRIMKGIRDGNVTFNSPEEIYDYFYNQPSVTAYGTESTLVANFKLLLLVVQNSMKSYLRDMPILKEYYDWIDNLVKFAIYWREHDKYFLLKMARHNDLIINDCWAYAVQEVGSPLMLNNKGAYFKIAQHGSSVGVDVEYFRAIRQIDMLFECGKTNCEMLEWCKNSPDVTPNDLCSTTPWKKCLEEQLCPYALIWKHWDLKDREPKRS